MQHITAVREAAIHGKLRTAMGKATLEIVSVSPSTSTRGTVVSYAQEVFANGSRALRVFARSL
jgi:hypothetical protein